MVSEWHGGGGVPPHPRPPGSSPIAGSSSDADGRGGSSAGSGARDSSGAAASAAAGVFSMFGARTPSRFTPRERAPPPLTEEDMFRLFNRLNSNEEDFRLMPDELRDSTISKALLELGLTRLVPLIDPSRDGRASALASPRISAEQFTKAFDLDGDGDISVVELLQGLKRLQHEVGRRCQMAL